MLVRVARYAARAGLIVGAFSSLYKLLRLVFGKGKASDSRALPWLSR